LISPANLYILRERQHDNISGGEELKERRKSQGVKDSKIVGEEYSGLDLGGDREKNGGRTKQMIGQLKDKETTANVIS